MKTIAFILPYYGKFPRYYRYFIESCANNPTIDWLIFTDIESDIEYPSNVHRIDLTFKELQILIQNSFEFSINLENPYKLCDFKPTYGYVFHDYIRQYDFWGYCDADVILGDLRKFITESLLDQYDKIGHLGHMSIIRNNNSCNTVFKKNQNYANMLSHNRIYVFDEWGENNINSTFLLNGHKVFFWNEFADIYPYDDNFRRVTTSISEDRNNYRCDVHINKNTGFGRWKDNKTYFLTRKKGSLASEEVAYIHFQKRVMPININGVCADILCTPNGFFEYIQANLKQEIKWNKNHIFLNKKKSKKLYESIKYWIIEKSGPIRHSLRRIRGKK